MATSCKRTYTTHCTFEVCCSQSPCPWGRLLTRASAVKGRSQRQIWLTPQILKSRSGSVSYGGSLLFSLGSGANKVFFAPSESLWQVWDFILKVILLTLSPPTRYCLLGVSHLPLDLRYIFGWDTTFSCQWLLSSFLQLWCFSRRWKYVPSWLPELDVSWWRVLTKRGPLEKEMENKFSILALRTPRIAWKGKNMWHWKMNFPYG